VSKENLHFDNQNVWFQKYPYLPHGREFFQHLPTRLEIPVNFINFFKFFALPEPLPPGNFKSLLWGEVWIFSGIAQLTPLCVSIEL